MQTNDKQKLKPMNVAMLGTHTLNNIVSIFVSTFLISYIYAISDNYIVNIGLFYASNYFSMMVFYFLISHIIDNTNRVSFYRIAIVIRGLFMVFVVFWGSKLAGYVIAAGLLHGFSEACYWTSYNLMKNELVSKHAVSKYSGLQHTICEIMNIVIPITLGKIIDSAHFISCAKIILIIVVLELFLSIFIKSKKPENASFNFKGFIKDIKSKGELGKLIVWSILIGGFYGFISVLAPLKTIMIMFEYNSDFSLGIITSIVAVVTLISIICFRHFTKIGNRKIIFIVSSVLPVIATIVLVAKVCRVTIIVYSFVIALCSVAHAMSYDVIRNILLKKLNLYDDIAEYQCSIECIMELFRVVGFGIMIIVGVFGNIFGNVFTALKVVMCISSLFLPLVDISLLFFEKKLLACGITED